MNLQSYIVKLVKLTLTNNKILIGKVIDFDDKVDNFDGYNSIEIDTGRITYDISENKIKTIVLQKWHPFYTDKEKAVLFFALL
ncbi:TPA: LSM domain protein [Staphylococcus aureus]|nr:LSM domain protein [Staphylococcus aureus]